MRGYKNIIFPHNFLRKGLAGFLLFFGKEYVVFVTVGGGEILSDSQIF